MKADHRSRAYHPGVEARVVLTGRIVCASLWGTETKDGNAFHADAKWSMRGKRRERGWD
jgi:hypothetical protein